MHSQSSSTRKRVLLLTLVMCQGCQGSVGVTVHFPLLELQVTYSMPELGAAGLRRGQSRFVWPWAPARLALPRAVQCQLSLAQWEATPCLLHQPQPHSCTTKSSSRPAAAGPRAVPWPWGAAPPSAVPCPHRSCRIGECRRFPPQQK